MKVPFFDIKEQYSSIRGAVIDEFQKIIESCSFVGGEYVKRFEEELGDYIDVDHVISCGNGTDALVLALKACGIGEGDEVITTSFSYFATAEAIAAVGAKPVFVDIELDTLTIAAYDIESKITPSTKAILPVHIFGHMCNMDKIMNVAKQHNLRVIEDCAQAIGASQRGLMAGTFGDIGCFSFYPTKNLGGAGDGGACITNDPELAVVLRALREHGAGGTGKKAAEMLHGKIVPGEEDKYTNYLVGFNSRLDAFQAAVLSIKLKHLNKYNEQREEIASMYEWGLTHKVKKPTGRNGDIPCWHQYVIRTDKKEELCEFLEKEGIGCGMFYTVPLHKQPAFSYLCDQTLERSETAAEQTVCLPIYPEMTGEMVGKVVDAVNRFFGEDEKLTYIDETAEVSDEAHIGGGTKIWMHTQIRENASVGDECNIGKNVYVDSDVVIGDRVKIQNNVSLYHGLTIGDDVFIGPSVVFTNDMYPRAFSEDWEVVDTRVEKGASIGAGAVIRCGVTIGSYATVGSGAVVTKDVMPHALVVGNPASQIGMVCKCGYPLDEDGKCVKCGSVVVEK